jgi:hypothetical protein
MMYEANKVAIALNGKLNTTLIRDLLRFSNSSSKAGADPCRAHWHQLAIFKTAKGARPRCRAQRIFPLSVATGFGNLVTTV